MFAYWGIFKYSLSLGKKLYIQKHMPPNHTDMHEDSDENDIVPRVGEKDDLERDLKVGILKCWRFRAS